MKTSTLKRVHSNGHRAFSPGTYLPRGIERIASATLLCCCFQLVRAQPPAPGLIDGASYLKVVGTLPATVKEASGLEMTSPGLLWTHNDDRFPILYGLDTTGTVVKAIHLNHPNNGWEDLTLDKAGSLYIGAFGNNGNDKKNLSILKISTPERITEKVINAERIEFEYSDQREFPPPESLRNFDADAFVSIGDSLYIITKNRTVPFTGYARVYKLPSVPGKYKAMLIDSIYLGNGPMLQHWVTSADVSPDGRWLALLSHDSIWLVSSFRNTRFSTGKIFRVNFEHFSHKAGLCFASDSLVYIVDELEFGFLGGKLYSLDLGEIMKSLQGQN